MATTNTVAESPIGTERWDIAAGRPFKAIAHLPSVNSWMRTRSHLPLSVAGGARTSCPVPTSNASPLVRTAPSVAGNCIRQLRHASLGFGRLPLRRSQDAGLTESVDTRDT